MHLLSISDTTVFSHGFLANRFITYFCVTNYPKTFISSRFLWIKNLGAAYLGSSVFAFIMRLQLRCQWRPHLRAGLSAACTPTLAVVGGDLSSLLCILPQRPAFRVLVTQQLASSRLNDPRVNKKEVTGPFVTWPRKSHLVISAGSFWLHRSATSGVGGDGTRAWMPTDVRLIGHHLGG